MNRTPSLILVDLDHTLFGGNSTELFIKQCKPSRLIMLMDNLIRRCIPWQLSGIKGWFRLRDYVFVRLILILFPKNLARWEANAPVLFSRLSHLELERQLDHVESKIVIITFGLEPLVRPLLRSSRWSRNDLLSTAIPIRLSIFHEGKLHVAEKAFGRGALSTAMLITDSLDDFDLLQVVGHPALILPFHG